MRNFLTQNLKILFAVHDFVFKSKAPETIADVVNLKPIKIKHWMRSYEWIEAIAYWTGNRPPREDGLGFAEQLWSEMTENSEYLSSVDYPDIPVKTPATEGDPSVYPLIHSHLFCAVDLCDEQIRARLAEERKFESPPVRYEGQALENAYHYWLYPNYAEGIYSKVLARANVIGDLVIGTGADTCLVIIRHGRLTITRQSCDDIVSVFDERLLVCL